MTTAQRVRVMVGATVLALAGLLPTPASPAGADDKAPLGGGAGIVVNGDTYCTLTTIGTDKTGALIGFTSAHCGGPGAQVASESAPDAGVVGTMVTGNDGLDYAVIRFDPAKVQPVSNWKGFAIDGIGDGVWDWDIKANHIVTSKRWREIMGFGSDNPAEMLEDWRARIHPDDLPPLITTMQDNQKYFCLLDVDGKLLPRFITVANIESKDPAQIVAGNEKVVRPRLTDAEFFFKQDKRQPLEQRNQRLANVVFQAQLGSVYDKAERVSKLAAFIAERIGGDASRAARAGILSKCDLASEMVGEFPEMQGIAGYYYAKHDGEPEDVAQALNEQYMPRGAGAELPQTLTGAAVAVADKLDTLVGIFGIGMLPTGSTDPYALRRAALGVLRILIEKQLDLDLVEAVGFAVGLYGDKVKAEGLAQQVLDFIFDRLRARYEDEGVDVAVYQAVRALSPAAPLDFDQRVQAVQAFRQLPEAAALAAANKRVSNILAKAEGQLPAAVDAKLLEAGAEQALAQAVAAAAQAVAPMAAARCYREALAQLASLREPVDAYFDAVMVNAEDAAVRANRLALLNQLRGLFLGVADISLLG